MSPLFASSDICMAMDSLFGYIPVKYPVRNVLHDDKWSFNACLHKPIAPNSHLLPERGVMQPTIIINLSPRLAFAVPETSTCRLDPQSINHAIVVIVAIGIVVKKTNCVEELDYILKSTYRFSHTGRK